MSGGSINPYTDSDVRRAKIMHNLDRDLAILIVLGVAVFVACFVDGTIGIKNIIKKLFRV
jgi:hypothetical protein